MRVQPYQLHDAFPTPAFITSTFIQSKQVSALLFPDDYAFQYSSQQDNNVDNNSSR